MNVTLGLRRALQLNPLGIAILEGERQLTWSELGARVSRLAGGAPAARRGEGRPGRGADRSHAVPT
jgi:hypothetical protein